MNTEIYTGSLSNVWFTYIPKESYIQSSLSTTIKSGIPLCEFLVYKTQDFTNPNPRTSQLYLTTRDLDL